ncbi:MAG TPA: alpha-amylase family glycosyl hydrolase, partial [Burkholderiales bacterium]|nr:alpha-amylase family glycosyl hydrolase [Burkholderiales bacterium]
LKQLNVTTLWVGPIFRQRKHLNTYHGYGIQDFLEVDPRFGTRDDLVALVQSAHQQGMRIILDVIFNHSGDNWLYPTDLPGGAYTPHYTGGRYPFGGWRRKTGNDQALVDTASLNDPNDGVWPRELQDPERYTRAGAGSLGSGDIGDEFAEHKRSDFIDLRDFNLRERGLLTDLAACYKYWIALTDCDGFRIDTLKHVSFEEARNFCGGIKEFAANLGKADFFLVGEVAGGDEPQQRYLDALDRNMNAALDIGQARLALHALAKGLEHPNVYFNGFQTGAMLGSHRNLGKRHVSILDDHDHVFGQKLRFSAEATSPHQIAAGVALQYFTLGIPCVYYGSEQSLGGPENDARQFLPEWKGSDRYLRETMFGGSHPLRDAGTGDGLQSDNALPGFGPLGTTGRHLFDPDSTAFQRIGMLGALRARFPVLRVGRQYLRPTSFLGRAFAVHGPGELLAWSRILDDEEALVIVNVHGAESRGADVIVDANLSGAALTVVLNTATADGGFNGSHPIGSTVPVQRTAEGAAFVAIRDLPPSETLVLVNRP